MLSRIKARVRGFMARSDAVVLTYHSVLKGAAPFSVWHHMNAAQFEEQIAYIARYRNCISVAELVRNLRQGKMQAYSVAVTFDDGFANNLHIALPILERYRVPATFFLTTGYLANSDLLWPERVVCILDLTRKTEIHHAGLRLILDSVADKAKAYRAVVDAYKLFSPEKVAEYLRSLMEAAAVTETDIQSHRMHEEYRMLSWEECRQMSQSGLVEFGSHTIRHSILTRISDEAAYDEIVQAKQILHSQHLIAPYFAYPNGGVNDYNLNHRRMAIEAGYDGVFSAICGTVTSKTDLYDIPRLSMGCDATLDQLAHALNGGIVNDSVRLRSPENDVSAVPEFALRRDG
jgi:peptidoglycan/xylan/chitin deacetylase (PgdA/CDA1 family)